MPEKIQPKGLAAMMMKKDRKIELLAPAGNFEKLEIAIHYGADAVYLGGKDFSLRNFSENFTIDEIRKAVGFAHKCGVKVYVACNVYPKNGEQESIKNYLCQLEKIRPDALIIADPGIFMLARDILPQVPLHLSTQANTTNYNSVMFWENLGVKRINVAREMSLKEIKEIASHSSVELEAFVHGAMCISYSGRCLLSSFMANRDGNRGLCCHPCRWKYAVVEETRPGQYFPVAEDDRGSYIFNSKDLCMIAHIPEMIESGVCSLKIEGRMKGINYVASVVKVYREAIDSYYANPDSYTVKKDWMEELAEISCRGYCTGFYFGDTQQVSPNYVECKYAPHRIFIGKVIEQSGSGAAHIDIRNKIFKGDALEILKRRGPVLSDKVNDIIDSDGQSVSCAQPGSRVALLVSKPCEPNDLLRRVDRLFETNTPGTDFE
jgi:putative protease